MNTSARSTIHTLKRVTLCVALVGVLLVAWRLSVQAQDPGPRDVLAMQQATATPAPTPRPVSTDVVIPQGRAFFYGRLVWAGWVWIAPAAIVVALIGGVVAAWGWARRRKG